MSPHSVRPSLPTLALVFGRANGVWEEVAEAKSVYAIDRVVAVGSAGIDYPESIDCWVSFHANKFPQWIDARARLGYAPTLSLWTARSGARYHPTAEQRRKGVKPLQINRVECWGGDSGLIGVTVALRVANRAILAGIPMDPNAGQYDHKDTSWDEALHHRAVWERQVPLMQGRVKSLSGWTRQLLGAPTGWSKKGVPHDQR